MRRVGGLWPEVTSFDNLLRATSRAAQGKRHQRHVARFLVERERLVLKLQRELRSGRYQPERMTSFVIHDPKLRTISVAPFRDRVVHHAVIDVLEPILDRRMIHASFACRRGKGTHAALDYAQRLIRRHRWFLKMDVERCFASISHALVTSTLSRIIKDRAVLGLVEQILEVGAEAPGVGLPVGNLTSQWLANLVLDGVDREATEHLRVPGYCRYMDDWVAVSDERDCLREARARFERRLESMGLRAKARATMLAPTRDGLPFLGNMLFPAVRRIRPANRKRILRRWKHRQWQWREGALDERALADCTRSVLAHLEHGTTRAWRRRWCAQLERGGPM